MSEPITLSTRLNSDAAWAVQAQGVDANGNATTVSFLNADAIEAKVWQGADSAPLFTPTAVWSNSATALMTLSVSAAQTAPLTAGVYPLEITVIPAATAQRIPALSAWLELTSTPGSAVMPPVYGTYDDMVVFGGGEWLETLRRKEGLGNFMREQALARSDLDNTICKKFRPWAGRTIHWSETTIVGPPDARNPVILSYLQADFNPSGVLPLGVVLQPGQTVLMVTDRIREVVALKALHYVARARVALEGGEEYARKANYFYALWSRAMLTAVAELDINQDGLADYAFPLGVINLR